MAGIDDDALARSLHDLTDRIGPDAHVRPLTVQLATVVSATVRLLGVESVGILLLDDADRVRCVAASGRAAEVLESAQERVRVGPGIDALADRAVVAVTDVAAEPRYGLLWPELAGGGVRAVLATPIWLDGNVVGNLNAAVPDPHVWSGPQQRAAQAVAAIVGQMLGIASRPAPEPGGDGEGRVR